MHNHAFSNFLQLTVPSAVCSAHISKGPLICDQHNIIISLVRTD